MNNRARFGLVLLALLYDVASAQASPSITTDEEPFAAAEALDRHELIRAVLRRNPSLESARQAWRAALERVPQARSLDDPTASLSIAPLSFGSSEVPTGEAIGFSQHIPFPGTLRIRGAIAEALAKSSEERWEAVRLRLATTASLLYDDFWLVDRALAITQEHVDLLTAFQRVATSRYATGTAPQQAPIQAEVEAAHLLHRVVVLQAERRAIAARINALLHREAAEPLPPASPEAGAEATELPDAAELASSARATRPDLAAQRAEIEARRAEVDLEKLAFRPDFEPMASFNSMWDTGEHRWMVGVNVRVPLRRQRLKAAVAEAEARLAESESELASLTDATGAEIEIALAAVEEARHVVRLYVNRVLPAARDQVSAARAAFETGASSMLELIDAERSLRTAELNHLEAVAATFSARAKLDEALGRLPFGHTATAPTDAAEDERNP